jgi:2-pyrone-4,6-dicarboxylate lactonase
MGAAVNAAVCLPPAPPTAPSFALPRGACDCDAHVVGPFSVYRLAAARPYDPPEAPYARLREMMDATGLDRVVIAHVSAHGMDLSVTLDAIGDLGERARGTAMLKTDVCATRLEALHAAGMRGVRLSRAYSQETPFDEKHLRLWADKVAPFGWHLALFPSSLEELQVLERVAPRLPVRIVLDHLASHSWFVDGQVRAEGLAVLDALLASGKAWLKLSGMEQAGAGAAPWEPLVAPIAQLAGKHLQRMLWASHWPFTGLHDPAQLPRSGDLLDWLARIGLDEEAREQVLVRNPEELYGFAPVDPTIAPRPPLSLRA